MFCFCIGTEVFHFVDQSFVVYVEYRRFRGNPPELFDQVAKPLIFLHAVRQGV